MANIGKESGLQIVGELGKENRAEVPEWKFYPFVSYSSLATLLKAACVTVYFSTVISKWKITCNGTRIISCHASTVDTVEVVPRSDVENSGQRSAA